MLFSIYLHFYYYIKVKFFQEDFAHLRVLSYPQTDVFLLCFSLVDPQSLEACRSVWMPEIRKFAGEKSIILLIGTKEDLAENAHKKSIDFKTAQRTANEVSFICFFSGRLTYFLVVIHNRKFFITLKSIKNMKKVRRNLQKKF